jgi:hypothetical protein
MNVTLSNLAIIMGSIVAVVNFYGVVKPASFTAIARKMPRSVPLGVLLTLGATAWFIYNLRNESIADFEYLKPYLYALFAGVGLGTCIFVRDYIGARGLAVMILLVSKLMVDTARWSESPWRLVIAYWAYIFVILGIWVTITPHRLRDMIEWGTRTPLRTRLFNGFRCAFGILVIILGLKVF